MKKLKEILFVIFNPNYWIMNYPYSEEWDEELNLLMDNHKFIGVDCFTSMLGDVEVWTENHPHGSFTTYGKGVGKGNYRPSRLTIHRAYKKYLAEI